MNTEVFANAKFSIRKSDTMALTRAYSKKSTWNATPSPKRLLVLKVLIENKVF